MKTECPRRRFQATALSAAFALLMAQVPAAQAIEVGAAAPPLELDGPAGRINLDQFRGKTVWLDFWASWCGPCKASFPWMNALQDKYRDQGLRIVAVNLDARADDAKRFLDAHPARFALAFDPQGTSPRRYQLKGMPTSVLIAADGQVRLVHSGFRESEQAELEGLIRNALHQGNP